MSHREDPHKEINPGLYGIQVNGYTGNETIVSVDANHDQLTLTLPPDALGKFDRIKIGQNQKIIYTPVDEVSDNEGCTTYMCNSHYPEGNLVAGKATYHPFSSGLYKIGIETDGMAPEYIGYLNVSLTSPGWYALGEDAQGEGYTLPLIIEGNQELSYENIDGPFSDPDEFLSFVESQMTVSSTYNVRVTPPDFGE